jgi:hypothetical protein
MKDVLRIFPTILKHYLNIKLFMHQEYLDIHIEKNFFQFWKNNHNMMQIIHKLKIQNKEFLIFKDTLRGSQMIL